MVRYRTHPDVPMFLEVLWSYHCQHIDDYCIKCHQIRFYVIRSVAATIHVIRNVPSQRAMQFRFLLCRNLGCPGCSWGENAKWGRKPNKRKYPCTDLNFFYEIIDNLKCTCLTLLFWLYFFMSSSLVGNWCLPWPISVQRQRIKEDIRIDEQQQSL